MPVPSAPAPATASTAESARVAVQVPGGGGAAGGWTSSGRVGGLGGDRVAARVDRQRRVPLGLVDDLAIAPDDLAVGAVGDVDHQLRQPRFEQRGAPPRLRLALVVA